MLATVAPGVRRPKGVLLRADPPSADPLGL